MNIINAVSDSIIVVKPNQDVVNMSNTAIKAVNEGLKSIGMNAAWVDKSDNIVLLIFIILLAFFANFICHRVVLKTIAKIVSHTKAKWDDILFSDDVLVHASHLVAPILIYIALPMAFPGTENHSVLEFLSRLCMVYIILVSVSFISSILNSFYNIFMQMEQFKNRPINGFVQIIKLLIYFLGVILIISTLINKSPTVLLTGLGASAAILMLVFKDSIMGFVSGIQLSANHMLKVGDWITVPKCGADGNVIEVTLNTVKVRNWDETITTIPPYLLVSDSFINWEGMSQSGGRRVQRAINIDMRSVHFCTQEMLDKFRRIALLSDYIDGMQKELTDYNKKKNIDNSVLVNGRRQTNLGVFRTYLTEYLKSLPVVNKNMTLMVRQLQPTETGIPLQLYFFSSIKKWEKYEAIQADIFDHVLAIIPEFGLRVFQNPIGEDFKQWPDKN